MVWGQGITYLRGECQISWSNRVSGTVTIPHSTPPSTCHCVPCLKRNHAPNRGSLERHATAIHTRPQRGISHILRWLGTPLFCTRRAPRCVLRVVGKSIVFSAAMLICFPAGCFCRCRFRLLLIACNWQPTFQLNLDVCCTSKDGLWSSGQVLNHIHDAIHTGAHSTY